MKLLEKILLAYGLGGQIALCRPFGTGLINHTWKIDLAGRSYILQKVNNDVFPEPRAIAYNVELIARYLRKQHPDYLFVAPVEAGDHTTMVQVEGDGFYRLLPFVEGSVSKEVAARPEEAWEAATQFGRFTRLLSGFDTTQLKTTIPAFHDLALRHRQFLQATREGDADRIREAGSLIQALLRLSDITARFDRIRQDPAFKRRVTHHDTKISNVLFDAGGRGLCVIDLDTVMPGYFISDVGDMMRTYLSPVSEEERDFGLISIRDEFYHAIVQGYYEEMKEELTAVEKKEFFYAGLFMIYMQALRFLTDHLLLDRYYGARYPGQNLVRAGNQASLLFRLIEKEATLTGRKPVV